MFESRAAGAGLTLVLWTQAEAAAAQLQYCKELEHSTRVKPAPAAAAQRETISLLGYGQDDLGIERRTPWTGDQPVARPETDRQI
jgi:hypothetical protein